MPPELGSYGATTPLWPGSPRVFVSQPNSTRLNRWGWLDLSSGEIRWLGKIPGALRDVLFDDADDRTALLLSEFDLVRVRFDQLGAAEVLDRGRPKGLGKYLWRFVPLDNDRTLITRFLSKSAIAVDRRSREVLGRVPAPAPHAAQPIDGGFRVYAPHGGECIEIRSDDLRRSASRPMPHGTRPLLAGEQIVLLTGSRTGADSQGLTDIDEIWRVTGETIAVLNHESLEVINLAPAPPGARDVLALDGSNRLVVSTDEGMSLVDRDSLEEVGRFKTQGLNRASGLSHTFVPAAQAVVILHAPLSPTGVEIVHWP